MVALAMLGRPHRQHSPPAAASVQQQLIGHAQGTRGPPLISLEKLPIMHAKAEGTGGRREIYHKSAVARKHALTTLGAGRGVATATLCAVFQYTRGLSPGIISSEV